MTKQPNEVAEELAEAWGTLIANLRFIKDTPEADVKFPGELRQDLCLSTVYEYVKVVLNATGADAELAAPLKQLLLRLTDQRRNRRKKTKPLLDEATVLLRIEAVACVEILMQRQGGGMKDLPARQFVATELKRHKFHATTTQIRDWRTKIIPSHPTLDADKKGSYQDIFRRRVSDLRDLVERGVNRKEIVKQWIKATVKGYNAGR